MSGGPGFYRGTTHDQTPFFANKEKKMIESKKWPSSFSKKVDISKVSLDVMKPWISKRITELLGVEDDIVIDYCMSQLRPTEAAAGELPSGDKDEISPKRLQINLTGFMAKSTGIFVKELWELLLSAQENPNGIPQQFLDEKKEEMQRMKEEQRRLQEEIEKRQELYRQDNENPDGSRRSNFSDALIPVPAKETEKNSSVETSKLEDKEKPVDTVKQETEKDAKAEMSSKEDDTRSVSQSISGSKSNGRSRSASSASSSTSHSSTVSSHVRRKKPPSYSRSRSRERRSRSRSVDKYRRDNKRTPYAYRRRERSRSSSLADRRWRSSRRSPSPRYRRRYIDFYSPERRRFSRVEPRGHRTDRRNSYDGIPSRYDHRDSRYVNTRRHPEPIRRRVSPRRPASPARRRRQRDRSVSLSYNSRPSSSRSFSRSVTPENTSLSSSRSSSAFSKKQKEVIKKENENHLGKTEDIAVETPEIEDQKAVVTGRRKMDKGSGDEALDSSTPLSEEDEDSSGSVEKTKRGASSSLTARRILRVDDAPLRDFQSDASASTSSERDVSPCRSASPVVRRTRQPSRERTRGLPRGAQHCSYRPPTSPRSSALYHRAREERYSPYRESRRPFRRPESPPRRNLPSPTYHGSSTYPRSSAALVASQKDGGDDQYSSQRRSPRRGRRESLDRRRSITPSISRSISPRSVSFTSSSASPPNGKRIRSVNLKKKSHSGRLRAWSTSSSDKTANKAKMAQTLSRKRGDNTEEHKKKLIEPEADSSGDHGNEKQDEYSTFKSAMNEDIMTQNGTLGTYQRTKSEEALRQKALRHIHRKTQNR